MKNYSKQNKTAQWIEMRKCTFVFITFLYALLCVQSIVTKVQTRKQTGTLSLSLYKAVMYLECSPFLEKERDGGGLVAPMCPFVAFFILPLLAEKCPFVTMHCTLIVITEP